MSREQKRRGKEGDSKMKAKKHIITTQDIDLVITDVTLLSIEEYEANKDSIPPIFECWWLRSPGSDSSNVANVYDDGYVNDDNVDYDNNVRPVVALRLPESGISNLNVGDKIEMAGHTWTILRDGLALCDDVVGRAAFRKDWKAKDANVYEASDIKKWLQEWATENGIKVQKMTEHDRIIDAYRNCITEPKCKDCPWMECSTLNSGSVEIPRDLALAVMRELEDPEETVNWDE